MHTTLTSRIIMRAAPILGMIALVPLVHDDYMLALIYLGIIAISALRYEREDFVFLVFGFCILLLGEYFFLLTHVEFFTRTTLLGVMPIWLPFLWAYIFVAMKRSVELFARYF